MNRSISRRLAGGVLAMLSLLAAPAIASHHMEDRSIDVDNTAPGATTGYVLEFRIGILNGNIAAGQGSIQIDFPAGFDVAGATFDSADSGVREGGAGAFAPFPGYAGYTVDTANHRLRIDGIDYPVTDGQTSFRLAFDGVVNAPAEGSAYLVRVELFDGPASHTLGSFTFALVTPPGVNLGASAAAPVTYASEIIATAETPVTLVNTGGDLDLRIPLGHNFSAGEVRYARVECDAGLVFGPGSAVDYVGGGAASIGALNGAGTGVARFSISAADAAVVAGDTLVISGNRSIAGTDPVSCTYGLYDYPSQAVNGGGDGRLVSATGEYLDFAPSTAFTAVAHAAVADVGADPSFSAFVASAPTTATTAALAQLTYGLAVPAPLKADGTAITLGDLHATGADGTRIVVDGDFSAAANEDGSYSGAALGRVYLSANGTDCTAAGGIAATTLDAGQAVFPVGATVTDRMLCLAPRAGVVIPAADYTAILATAPAAPTVYAVDDVGPLDAGTIEHNGTQLQAPLAQLPGSGWLSRLVLTNTGGVDRPYTIEVIGEDGNTISTANLTGTVLADSVLVVDLDDVMTDATGKVRGTLNVTVAGPDEQIQGLFQIVNSESGSISNHVMVRPGKN